MTSEADKAGISANFWNLPDPELNSYLLQQADAGPQNRSQRVIERILQPKSLLNPTAVSPQHRASASGPRTRAGRAAGLSIDLADGRFLESRLRPLPGVRRYCDELWLLRRALAYTLPGYSALGPGRRFVSSAAMENGGFRVRRLVSPRHYAAAAGLVVVLQCDRRTGLCGTNPIVADRRLSPDWRRLHVIAAQTFECRQIAGC